MLTRLRPSGMGRVLAAVIAVVTAGHPALAELPEGCWTRSYDVAHLAAQPGQVVSGLRLRFLAHPEFDDVPIALMAATARDGGAELRQFLLCGDLGEVPGCAVECDGGWIDFIDVTPGTLTFETPHLVVGEIGACGGVLNLAEGVAQTTTYRLDRAEAAACADLTWEPPE